MTNKEILKRLYKDYTNKYLNKIILAAFFSITLAASTSAVAYLLDPAINELFINKSETLLYIIPFFIVIAFIVKGGSLYLAKVIMINVSEEVKKDIQTDMFSSLIKADTQLVDNKHSGKFVGNLMNDVNMIVNLISTAILNLFKDSLTLIGLLSVMFYQNWKLSLIAIIMIPLASFAAKVLGKRMGKVVNEQMQRAGVLTSYLIEIFKNHKLIKIFQKENFEKERSDNYLNDLKEKSKKTNIILVRASPIMETLTGIMIAILIFYSGKLIIKGELDVNNFFSFLAAMMLAYQPVRSLATLNIAINQSISASKRVLPLIDHKSSIIEKSTDKDLKIDKANIEFKDVNFSYDTEDRVALKSANLKMDGGKMTALIGLSGAGKSTILNLIPRFYDRNSGDISIDNQSIYQINLFSLRKDISLVSQDTTLFDDTIKNNIKYANLNATDDEILEAAKNSFAHDFIENLPNKYEALIGENGVRLSGGEKQRISIARAMLKKSPIILLDEATSSLDAETENKIQKAINKLTKNKTTIVIAHRLSTILNASKIYVVESGKILESGTHENLLNNSQTYKNFYDKQLRKD